MCFPLHSSPRLENMLCSPAGVSWNALSCFIQNWVNLNCNTCSPALAPHACVQYYVASTELRIKIHQSQGKKVCCGATVNVFHDGASLVSVTFRNCRNYFDCVWRQQLSASGTDVIAVFGVNNVRD